MSTCLASVHKQLENKIHPSARDIRNAGHNVGNMELSSTHTIITNSLQKLRYSAVFSFLFQISMTEILYCTFINVLGFSN